MNRSSRELQERATELLLRRERDSWSKEDQAELDTWIGTSTENRVAFLRAEAAWESMGRLKALGAGLPRREVPSPEVLNSIQLGMPGELEAAAVQATALPAQPRRAFARAHRVGAGIAASLLVVLGVLIGSSRLWFTGERYVTAVGAVASLPLADGSRITLNTDSKVHVVFDEQQRHIDLSQGEAFFEVAHDAQRPFVVQAGKQRIVAVGTQFSVRREGDGVQVVVTEGRVRVENGEPKSGEGPQPAATNARTRSAKVLLSAGGVAHTRQDDVVVQNHPLAEAEEFLSWRSGDVFFRETRLDEAVAEFNRYNQRQIVIRDPNVAAMLLTGKFRATNTDAFVNLLERTYGIEVVRTEASISLGSPPAAQRE